DVADREKSADASSMMEAGCDDYEEKSMPELSSAFYDKYEEMVRTETPDLWARIEASLPEKQVKTISSNVVVMNPNGLQTTKTGNVNAQMENAKTENVNAQMENAKTGNVNAQMENEKTGNVNAQMESAKTGNTKTGNAKTGNTNTGNSNTGSAKKRRTNIRVLSGILAACACLAICIPAIMFVRRNDLFKNQTTSNSESMVEDTAADKGSGEEGTLNNFFQSLHEEDAGATADFAPAGDVPGAEIMEEASCEAAEPENGTDGVEYDDMTNVCDDFSEAATSEEPSETDTSESEIPESETSDSGTEDDSENYIYYDGNQILDKADYTVEELHYENEVLISMVVRSAENRRYVIIPTEGRLVIEEDDGVKPLGYVTLPEDLAEGDVLNMKLYDATALTGSFYLLKLY
ncbi:MAG: hypothetical protein ACI4DU_02170, partial [Lachnospiraceae bacterium]